MAVPPSFDAAYRRQHKIGERIQRLAGHRLGLMCVDKQWLFSDRVKSAESALAKLQLGFMRDLSRMRDVYAATVVVGTRDELKDAVYSVRSAYPNSSEAPRTRRDPARFMYDDIHVVAALAATAPGEPDEVKEREFEIQVRTGLQYAWWRATHDKLYKGSSFDWKLERVAGQVRGSLEMLDGILADLAAGANLLDPAGGDIDERREAIVKWLELWPNEQRSHDVRAFSEAVDDLLTGGGVTLPGGEYLLSTTRGRGLIENPDVTPAQALAIMIAELRGVSGLLRRGKRRGERHRKRWLLITEEMEAVSEAVTAVPQDRRTRLD